MKETGPLYSTVIVCVIFILASSGCLSVSRSPSPRFYTLRAVDKDQVSKTFNIPSDAIIAVGPVTIPQYLNRPQIATQDKNGMLTFSEFDRWGESLDSALARLINEDLTAMLMGATIEMSPWNLAIPVKFQVVMEVIQFESRLDKDLFLALQWSIIDIKNKKMAFTKRSEFRQPIEGNNYSGLVQALSTACAALSSEIAVELSSLANQSDKKVDNTVSQ